MAPFPGENIFGAPLVYPFSACRISLLVCTAVFRWRSIRMVASYDKTAQKVSVHGWHLIYSWLYSTFYLCSFTPATQLGSHIWNIVIITTVLKGGDDILRPLNLKCHISHLEINSSQIKRLALLNCCLRLERD